MKRLVPFFAAVAFAVCSCGNQAAEENCCCSGDSTNECTKEMTTQSDNFIFAADKEWEDAGNGVVRQVMGYNDNIMMVKVLFKKGQVGSMHSHPHSQVTYVASGKFEFTVGGVTKIVEAGDALYKQPGIEHGCVCLEDGLLIDCFNPMRDTFIQK